MIKLYLSLISDKLYFRVWNVQTILSSFQTVDTLLMTIKLYSWNESFCIIKYSLKYLWTIFHMSGKPYFLACIFVMTVSRQIYAWTKKTRLFEKYISEYQCDQRNANLCGACAHLTDERSVAPNQGWGMRAALVRWGVEGEYNQGSYVCSTRGVGVGCLRVLIQWISCMLRLTKGRGGWVFAGINAVNFVQVEGRSVLSGCLDET